MSNTTAHFNDDGKVHKITYNANELRLGFGVGTKNGDTVAVLQEITTKDLDEGYDPLRAYVSVKHLEDALAKVAGLDVVDRVESVTEQRQREDTEE